MADQQSSFQTLASWLQSMGLGSLFSVDAAGNPGGWLWSQVTSGGVDTVEELQSAVESTDVWRDRYQAIVNQRAAAARGEGGPVMSVNEVLEYERRASAAMRSMGVAPWAYDSYKDFIPYMSNGVSIAEVEQRLGEDLNRVRNVAPEIREAFDSFYGVGQGDAALLAYFMDPNKAMEQLSQVSRAAYTAGQANRMGLAGVDRGVAELVAKSPMGEGEIYGRLQQAGSMGDITRETFGERTDITSNDALKAAVLEDAGAKSAIERRLIQRKSVEGATGGALVSQSGVAT